jgi:histidinol phosphatase-like enzyme
LATIVGVLRRSSSADNPDGLTMNHRGVFLDLNGTLVEPLKRNTSVNFTIIPGVVQAVARLSAVSFVCPVVTVQSCIAKGPFSAAEFNIRFAQFAADFHSRGARVVGPCVSPSLHRTMRVLDEPNTTRLSART